MQVLRIYLRAQFKKKEESQATPWQNQGAKVERQWDKRAAIKLSQKDLPKISQHSSSLTNGRRKI